MSELSELRAKWEHGCSDIIEIPDNDLSFLVIGVRSEPCNCELCNGKGTHQKFSLYRYCKIGYNQWMVSVDIQDTGPYSVLKSVQSYGFVQTIPQ